MYVAVRSGGMDHVEAISRLMHQYGYRIDDGDFAGVGDLFRRGRLVMLGSRPVTLEGAEAVHRAMEDALIVYDGGTPRTKHLTSNILVDLDDDARRATARCYVTVLQAVAGDLPLQPIFSGNYQDRFARADDGWYFEERVIRSDLIGDMSRHRRDMRRR